MRERGEGIHIAQVVRPAAGGMRRHVETLLTHLDTRRFAPTLFAPADFSARVPGETVLHHPFDISARNAPFADWRAIRELSRLLRGQFALVHAHGLRGALIGVLAARRAGIPAVFTAHNLVPSLRFLSRFFLALLGRRAERVIAVSQAVCDTLAAAGVPKEKIVVIPNGIDLAPFDAPMDTMAVRAKYGLAESAPLVLAVGRFAPEKGFDVLLDAFSEVRTQCPGAQLALVGSGPLEQELRLQTQGGRFLFRASDAPPVVFTGYQSEVAPLLLAADVVAIPSREEGQGIVALEAMAARKPVVASRVGGLTETIVESETGLLVAPNSPASLAEALTTLLISRPRGVAMGQAGRDRVERQYTAVVMAERISALYKELLSLSEKRRGD